MILALSIIEVSEEQRVRVPSAKRTEYESQPSNAADFLPHRTRTRTQRSGTRTRRLLSAVPALSLLSLLPSIAMSGRHPASCRWSPDWMLPNLPPSSHAPRWVNNEETTPSKSKVPRPKSTNAAVHNQALHFEPNGPRLVARPVRAT